MQTKTIRKKIESAMEEWLKTITDESLRKQVREKLLVSGGSICSMFLNLEVNDYDVYLQDMDVAVALAKYYTKPFSSIKVLDGRKKEQYFTELSAKYAHTGGFNDNPETDEDANDAAYNIAVRNLKPNQVKLFFNDKNGGMKVNEDKKPEELNHTPMFFSSNAISLSNKLQIVLRFTGDADQIHQTFDFIHATNYFTFNDGLITNKPALESILTKQLRYQGSQYPLTSIIRVKKFIGRGWNINAGEMLKIMFQISELDLHNPDVLEEQLVGIDVAYFSLLIGILRGVEPSKLTSEYLNAIIDKVFNDCEEAEQ